MCSHLAIEVSQIEPYVFLIGIRSRFHSMEVSINVDGNLPLSLPVERELPYSTSVFTAIEDREIEIRMRDHSGHTSFYALLILVSVNEFHAWHTSGVTFVADGITITDRMPDKWIGPIHKGKRGRKRKRYVEQSAQRTN